MADTSTQHRENASMDQGIAVVIGGIAGLVGAGIGGLAIAYGARIGAHKTIEAAETQVQHQATSEHRHWVRDQRRAACSEIMKQLRVVGERMAVGQTRIRDSEALPSGLTSEVQEETKKLIMVASDLQLWGPTELVGLLDALLNQTRMVFLKLKEWGDIPDTADVDQIEAHQAAAEETFDVWAQARRAFIASARQTLAADH